MVPCNRSRKAPLFAIRMDKSFEFGVADQTAAIDALDDWVDSIAQNRSHVAPHELPFKALRVILGQCMYGGRIDNVYDQHVIDLLLDRIFTPDIFNADFYLVGRCLAPRPRLLFGGKHPRALHRMDQRTSPPK